MKQTCLVHLSHRPLGHGQVRLSVLMRYFRCRLPQLALHHDQNFSWLI